MKDQEKKLELLNDGRMASLAAEHFLAITAKLKLNKMSELSQNFRTGKVDQATLLCSVAGYCALEDLENKIKGMISKGEKISQELNREI